VKRRPALGLQPSSSGSPLPGPPARRPSTQAFRLRRRPTYGVVMVVFRAVGRHPGRSCPARAATQGSPYPCNPILAITCDSATGGEPLACRLVGLDALWHTQEVTMESPIVRFCSGGTLAPDSRVTLSGGRTRFSRCSSRRGVLLRSRLASKGEVVSDGTRSGEFEREGRCDCQDRPSAFRTNLDPERWYAGCSTRRPGARAHEGAVRLLGEHQEFGLAAVDRGHRERGSFQARKPARGVRRRDRLRALSSVPTDEFFAGIRECYNRRADDPAFAKLTFCLLGVATPAN